MTIVADRMTPPAGAIADRYSTLAAILIVATVLTTLVASRGRLGRPGRLAAVVVLLATAMPWYSARPWVHEKEFDYLVAQQKTDLELRGIELAGDIANFLRARARHRAAASAAAGDLGARRERGAPLRTGNRGAVRGAVRPAVRRIREMFSLRGLIDRDLDAFYRRPATAFEIGVVARRLAVLARRLGRSPV